MSGGGGQTEPGSERVSGWRSEGEREWGSEGVGELGSEGSEGSEGVRGWALWRNLQMDIIG